MAGFLRRYLSPRRCWRCSLDGTIDRRASDAEYFGNLGRGVRSALVKANEVRFLDLRELWLFPSEPAFGLCHCHSLPRPGADKIGFELGNYAQDIE